MIYRYGRFRLDTQSEQLCRAGTPVELRPKTRALLIHLIRNRDRGVSKDELLATVWPGRRIEPQGVFQSIWELRAVFGRPDPIRTVRGRGYQWVARVAECEPAPSRSASPAARAAVAGGLFILAAAVLSAVVTTIETDSVSEEASPLAASRLDRAREWMSTGRIDAAQRTLEDILRSSPGHISARLDLARIRFIRGEADAALSEARLVHRDAGLHGSQFERMTSALLISQIVTSVAPDPDLAAGHAQEAADLGAWLGAPAIEGLAREQLGNIASRNGRQQEALAAFNRALGLLRDLCPDSERRIRVKIDAIDA